MNQLKALTDFFEAIGADHRVSITHIGVYAALLKHWSEHNYSNPIVVFSHEIMKIAKLSSRATYQRAVKALSDYGYLTYIPSYKNNQGSKIYFPFRDK